MLLGDDTALTLGTDLHRLRMVCLAVTALMTGLAVWAAGIIGFVGLVVPHGVRLLFGADHRRLVPLAALAGGCSCSGPTCSAGWCCPATSCRWAF